MILLCLPVLALTVAEFGLVLSWVMGTGGIGALITGVVALRRIRLETTIQQSQVRTVAADEAEKAVQILGVAVARLDGENIELRKRSEDCEIRYRRHMRVCHTEEPNGE